MQDSSFPARSIDYLRISVTDRCNLRCFYCMPKDGIELAPKSRILSFEEILKLVKMFAYAGIKRIRITGGEPLVRNGLPDLIRNIAALKTIKDISMTTNGLLLSSYARPLKEAGVKRINISLDTLNSKKFEMITGKDGLHDVLDGIKEAQNTGFNPLKLNVVVMKGINDNEICDFMDFALANRLILRFIEFMRITPLWREDLFVPLEEIKKICEERFTLRKLENRGPSPAEHYAIDEDPILGFIKTDQSNCAKCSRLRLTAVGELKLCLYEKQGINLKPFIRENMIDGEILEIIRRKISLKKNLDYRKWKTAKTFMYSLGG